MATIRCRAGWRSSPDSRGRNTAVTIAMESCMSTRDSRGWGAGVAGAGCRELAEQAHSGPPRIGLGSDAACSQHDDVTCGWQHFFWHARWSLEPDTPGSQSCERSTPRMSVSRSCIGSATGHLKCECRPYSNPSPLWTSGTPFFKGWHSLIPLIRVRLQDRSVEVGHS